MDLDRALGLDVDLAGVDLACAFGLLDDGVVDTAAFFFGGAEGLASPSESESESESIMVFLRFVPWVVGVDVGLVSLEEKEEWDR